MKDEAYRRRNATDWLKNNIKAGDRLYGIVHSSTGKGQVVQLLWVTPGRLIEDVTKRVALACSLRLMKRGVFIPGYGHNHIAAAVENLEMVLGVKLNQERIFLDQS